MKRISIEGNIGASKSTLLAGLQDSHPEIAFVPEPVQEWGEWLDMYYRDIKRWCFGFQMKALASYLKTPPPQPVVVYERSPMSNKEVFTQMLFAQGNMAHKEFELYKSIYEHVAWQPDAIIFVKCSPEACLARVGQRNRSAEQGLTLDYLRKVDFHYAHMLNYFKGPVLYVDGEHPDGPEGVLQEAQACLDALLDKST